MASRKSTRRSRKRRDPARAPRAVTPPRRPPRSEQRAERRLQAEREQKAARRQLGTHGERPPGPFGGVPVSEIAIFAGLIAIIVWLVRGGTTTLVIGLVVVTLGVLEVTAREHFSG